LAARTPSLNLELTAPQTIQLVLGEGNEGEKGNGTGGEKRELHQVWKQIDAYPI